VSGRVSINGTVMVTGDIFIFNPMEISDSEFLEDTSIVVIRTPSEPFDKRIIGEEYARIADDIFSQCVPTDHMVGVEIGTRRGHLSEAFLAANPSLTMYSIDYWGTHEQILEQHDHASNYKAAVERLRSFGPRSIIVNKLSTEAVKYFKDEQFDFVYIDATHTHKAVCEDIACWAPKIKRGGLICGHDYCDGWPGVISAVQENITDPSKLKLFPCNVWAINVDYIK
jgi:hypothetical protein